MAVVENSVEIARPIEEVFDFTSDMRNELKWNPDVESMEQITEGTVALGTRYQAKWHTSPPVTTECTHFERPSSFSFHTGRSSPDDLTPSLTPPPPIFMLTRPS